MGGVSPWDARTPVRTAVIWLEKIMLLFIIFLKKKNHQIGMTV